ncbi:MAG: hypothetical protein ACP5OG_00690 [Candidatus Nanoarchaeia archaeon]
MENSEIENLAESEFKKWLEKHQIPYLYISQSIDTFSSVFKDTMKRPDFMILLENFGFILADVKNKRIRKEYGTYIIDANETKKYSSLQRKFNLQIWYVLSNEDFGYKTWLWIPTSKVLEYELKKQTSNKSGEDFFPIPAEEFIQISDKDSIDKLFVRNL